MQADREVASKEARAERSDSPERRRLFRVVQELHADEERLEQTLQTQFAPQHGKQQLISPRAFFVSPLFRVASRQTPREQIVSLALTTHSKECVLQYTGPELRQSDGMVFMTLLRIARDTQLETSFEFSPEEVCREVFGRYDGSARLLLRDHIKRLQKGLVEFGSTSVQLCLRFDFPSRGQWSVAVDGDIVTLFSKSAVVWVDRARRKEVPEGLASWLYGFIESQSRLIPTSVEAIRSLCGSDASSESFVRLLRRALNDLADHQVIDRGWSVGNGVVRWMKATRKLEA